MDEKLAELHALLASLLRCHQQLVETAIRMNTCLRNQDVVGVRTTTIAYDELACQIEDLEEQRLELCDTISLPGVIQTRHSSLSNIIECAGTEQKTLFADIQQKLKATIKRFSEINASNQVLLAESLSVFGQTMEIFTRNTSAPIGYNAPGHKEPETIRRRLFNQIA